MSDDLVAQRARTFCYWHDNGKAYCTPGRADPACGPCEAADRIETLERRLAAADAENRGHVAAAELAAGPGKITAFRDLMAAASPCCAEKRELRERLAAVLAFYQELYDMAGDGGDVDGGSLQDLGVKHGLLEEVEVTEPCGKACTCEEYDNIPGTCYRQADWVRAAAEGEGTK